MEGTKTPSLVWTDHKNLEYICSAKRLNSHQARWSLFFTSFNLFFFYHPGSRNIKPAALSTLSKVLVDDETAPNPNAILHAPHLVATLTWEIEE